MLFRHGWVPIEDAVRIGGAVYVVRALNQGGGAFDPARAGRENRRILRKRPMSSVRAATTLASVLLVGVPNGDAAAPRWVEVRSPHFIVLSDAGEGLATHTARQFERFRSALSGTLPWARRLDPGVPLLIFLARNEATFRALLPEFWEREEGLRPDGVFRRSTRRYYIVLRAEAILPRIAAANPYNILYHEYAHLVVDLNMESIPLWLNEGLAEFLGGTVVEKNRVEVGWPIVPHLRLLKSQAPLTVAQLFKIDESSPEYNERERSSMFYAQSWALVHCLTMGDQAAANRIGHYIALRSAHTVEPEAALIQAFGDPAALDRALKDYLARGRLAYGYRNTEGREAERPLPWREVPPAEIAATRGLFLADQNRPAEARPLLEEAVRLDPQQAAAREGLGALAWKEGKEDGALRSLAEAVALPSASATAHYLHAQLVLRRAQDEPGRQEAQRSLERAIALDPGFAAAHAQLAWVLASNGAEVERVQGSIRQAIVLEPSVFDHRLAAARLFLLCGKIDEARDLGGELLARARLERERTSARAFLASLRSPAAGLVRDLPALVAVLERRCKWGDATDCLELGDRYCAGAGVKTDPSKAVPLYEQACEKELFEACVRLGSLLVEGKQVRRDESRGLGLCAKACDGGYPAGCGALGSFYLERGDHRQAASNLTKACEGGDAVGCANLALIHEHGLGVAKNARRAAELRREACEGGLTSSCAR